MAGRTQFNINEVMTWVTQNVNAVEGAAFHAVQDAISDGEQIMRKRIETAVTETGLARAGKGGHPGRIESGTMLDDISNDLTDDVHNGHGTIVGRFGWLDQAPEYFLVQEYGTEHIEAMGSLGLGAAKAMDTLRARLNERLRA